MTARKKKTVMMTTKTKVYRNGYPSIETSLCSEAIWMSDFLFCSLSLPFSLYLFFFWNVRSSVTCQDTIKNLWIHCFVFQFYTVYSTLWEKLLQVTEMISYFNLFNYSKWNNSELSLIISYPRSLFITKPIASKTIIP